MDEHIALEPNSPNDFYWALLRLSMAVKKRFIEPAEAHGLTALQSITLCILRTDQPCTMSSIAKFASCDPSNLSDTVERLVKSGLVERKEAPNDRRSKLLSLTAKGQQVREQIFKAAAGSDLPGVAVLNSEEAAEFRHLLIKSLSND